MDIHIQSFSIPHFPSLMLAMAKPAYLAITEHAPTKPVIIFVPSRKQCRMTAADILVYCLADGQEDKFLNIEMEQLQPHLDHITEKGLVDTLKHGVGYYHEALSKQDKRIVERLFEAGAIQVLIASRVSGFLPALPEGRRLSRKLRGVCRSQATWSSSWAFSTLRVANTDTSTILSPTYCR